MNGQQQLIEALTLLLERIETAAKDGQNGSTAYALDRLRLIQQYAEIGLKKTV
jgi:hypothetical protein